MAKSYEEEVEELRRKQDEKALNRRTKAIIQSDDSTRPLKMLKFHVKKKALVKQITCERCGKTFKTNSDKKICFDCQKRMG